MTAFKHLLKLLAGILGFVIIWVICLALSPVFLMVIGTKYAQEFIAAKKVEKILAPDKTIWHVPATKDNNIHSFN
jgi:hypothetical protein